MELTEQEPETEAVGQGMQSSEPVLPEIVPGIHVCMHLFNFSATRKSFGALLGKLTRQIDCLSFKNGVFITVLRKLIR